MALRIQNDGPRIVSSNFWDSEMACRGFFFLSFNAGAARLLVPDSRAAEIPEMMTAKLVVISRGPGMGRKDMMEILFDDDSDAPYSMHLGVEQVDRLLPAQDHGRAMEFSAWGREAVQLFSRPCRFRMAEKIPCLESWD